MKTKVLVTGANGQLGKTLTALKSQYNTIDFTGTSAKELDITNSVQVAAYFKENQIDWCVNCAAYTAVDKAETEPENAENVNVVGSKNLAIACAENNVVLIPKIESC